MLKNMVALVTGGAGSLGLATVKKLIENECKVMMLDLRDVDKEEDEAIKKKYLFHGGDITSEEDMKKAFEKIKTEFGRLDVIVNCAGVLRSRLTYSQTTPRTSLMEEFGTVLDVNVKGLYNVVQLGVRLIAENKPDPEDGLRGVIVNTSGFGSYNGQMGQVQVSAAWGAIESMTLPLARDFSSIGVRVVTISPGLMESKLLNIIPKKVKDHFALATLSPKRLGKPEEYADLVVAIIQNRFLNGAVLRLDGGLRLNLY